MRSQHWIALSIAVSTLVISYCIFSPSALPKLWQMRQKEKALLQQISQLKSELLALTLEVQLLNDTSPKSRALLERVAREELGMIAADEIILQLH